MKLSSPTNTEARLARWLEKDVANNLLAHLPIGVVLLEKIPAPLCWRTVFCNAKAQELLFGQEKTIPHIKEWHIFREMNDVCVALGRLQDQQISYEFRCAELCVQIVPTEENRIQLFVKPVETLPKQTNPKILNTLFLGSPMAHLLLSPSQEVLVINAAAQLKIDKLFDTLLNEGETLDKFKDIKGFELFEKAFEKAKNGVATTNDIKLETHRDHQYWLRVRMQPIFNDNELLAISVTATDITQKKISEQMISESEEKLKAIFESSYDALFLVGEKLKRILDCNQRAVEMFEVANKESLVGESLPFLKQYKSMIDERIKAGKVFLEEIQYTSGAGKFFWGSTAVGRIKIGNNHFKLIRITDISERKRMEAELLAANEKSIALSRVKDDFLAVMSHEIRTPLNGVIGSINLLLSQQYLPTQSNTLDALQFSAKHLMLLINDLLDFNKITEDKVIFEKKPLNINHLLTEVQQSFISAAREKNLPVIAELDPSASVLLLGDSLRIAQIVSNLINNAIKFTEKGAIYLRTKAENSDDLRHKKVRVEIADTGIGIPAHKIESIFDRFTQADSDTARRFGGTGLGLTIVKRLLTLMDSDIEVESQVNEGSCFAFTLKLPLVASDNNLWAAGQHPPTLPALPNVSVLVVEDNEINRYVICQFLQQWQIMYDIAESGEQALKLVAENNHYRLIFMDLQMPDMDGYETSQQIRKMGTDYHQQVPIIALTAAMLSDSLQKLNDCGINDYLGKPFEPAQLHQTIEIWSKHLTTARMTEQLHTPFNIVVNFDKMFYTCKGVSEEMLKCMDLYVKYFGELQNDFGKAVQNNDEKKLSNWAHNLKPIMSIAGIDDQDFLREQIAQVRQYTKQGAFHSQEVVQGIENVSDYCTSLLQILEEKKQKIMAT